MSEPITAAEYAAGVRAARTECEQEIRAAGVQYHDEVRPAVAARKQRGRDARTKRDERIAGLRGALKGGA